MESLPLPVLLTLLTLSFLLNGYFLAKLDRKFDGVVEKVNDHGERLTALETARDLRERAHYQPSGAPAHR